MVENQAVQDGLSGSGRKEHRWASGAGLARAALAVAASSLLLAPGPAGAGEHQNLHGTFAETTAGAGLGYDLHGSAKLRVDPDGTTVTIHIAGLDPTKRYGSHLHNGTCASGGGGHYQHDVNSGVVTPPNELWLSSTASPSGPLVPNAGGVGHGRGTATWEVRLTSTATNARSIIVHEPVTGTRIACADLT